jgi:hypothetical protein
LRAWPPLIASMPDGRGYQIVDNLLHPQAGSVPRRFALYLGLGQNNYFATETWPPSASTSANSAALCSGLHCRRRSTTTSPSTPPTPSGAGGLSPGCGPPAPFARGDGDLPLPKPVRSAILASKRPGIWRMSVKTKPAHAADLDGLIQIKALVLACLLIRNRTGTTQTRLSSIAGGLHARTGENCS